MTVLDCNQPLQSKTFDSQPTATSKQTTTANSETPSTKAAAKIMLV